MKLENKFVNGQIVICKSNNFPKLDLVSTCDCKKEKHPIDGEQLQIDETNGNFIRFKKYDGEKCRHWWIYSAFLAVEAVTPNEVQK